MSMNLLGASSSPALHAESHLIKLWKRIILTVVKFQVISGEGKRMVMNFRSQKKDED